MKENLIEDRLVRGCRRYGFVQAKAEPLGAGWPDRIVFGFPEQTAFIELKRPGDPEARRRQRAIHAMLRGLGFRVEVAHTPELVERFLTIFNTRCQRQLQQNRAIEATLR